MQLHLSNQLKQQQQETSKQKQKKYNHAESNLTGNIYTCMCIRYSNKKHQKTEICGLEQYSINLCCQQFAVVLPWVPAHRTVNAYTVVFSCYFFTQFKHMKGSKEPLKSSYLSCNITCFLFQSAISHPCFRFSFRTLAVILVSDLVLEHQQSSLQNTISHPCFRFCFRTLSVILISDFVLEHQQSSLQNTSSHPCFRFCFHCIGL